jgi:hypothetical protein
MGSLPFPNLLSTSIFRAPIYDKSRFGVSVRNTNVLGEAVINQIVTVKM